MNRKYDEGRDALGTTLNLTSATIDLVAVDEDYTFDEADSSSDLSGHVLDTVANLGSKAVGGGGYFTSASAVFTGLTIGEDPAAFVLRVQSGALLAYIDTLDDDTPVLGTIIGDGDDVTINPPTLGWMRV